MDSSITSNTPGFGMTGAGTYSPRLEVLQTEMASGQYTTMDQAAMLGRQIAAAYNGTTGDMNATGSSSGFDQLMRDVMKQPSSGATGSGDTALISQIRGDVYKGSSSALPAWITENVTRFVLVVIGIVFLFGSFMTFRK